MQQDNNIQQKLQQLENQQLPDLSQMDIHWGTMENMLQPVALVSKPSSLFTKLVNMLAVVVVIIIGIFFIFRINFNNDPEQKNATTNEIAKLNVLPAKNNTEDSLHNALIASVDTNSLPPKFIFSYTPVYSDVNIAPLLSDGDTLKEDFIFNENNFDQEKLTTELFRQLSKPAQHFLVNNNKDTTLVCKEGTVLKIPAQSLGGKDSIDFEITEFYEYSDMVMNRLITKSDNDQLISGGMLKLKAYQNEKELDILSGNKIQVFVPGITEKDSMLIFKEKKTEGADSVSFNVNWTLSNLSLSPPLVDRYIRAIDFRDDFNFIRRESEADGSRLKALFEISSESGLSRSRIKTIMKEKYPEYRKMRFKKIWNRNLFFRNVNDGVEIGSYANGYSGLGDTSYFEFANFYRYKNKHEAIDTVYGNLFTGSNNKWFFMKEKNQAAIDMVEKYSFLLDNLGWINCDRFYNYPGRKTEFYVDIPVEAQNYYTIIVFDKFKSLMRGYIGNNNKVIFPGLPVGEAVWIISIGVNKEGRSVMAMQQAIIGKQHEKLIYKEQDKEGIKNSLGILDK